MTARNYILYVLVMGQDHLGCLQCNIKGIKITYYYCSRFSRNANNMSVELLLTFLFNTIRVYTSRLAVFILYNFLPTIICHSFFFFCCIQVYKRKSICALSYYHRLGIRDHLPKISTAKSPASSSASLPKILY